MPLGETDLQQTLRRRETELPTTEETASDEDVVVRAKVTGVETTKSLPVRAAEI